MKNNQKPDSMKANNSHNISLPALINYGRHFSSESLWDILKKQASKLGREMVYYILVLYYLLIDRETPWKYKSIILGALGYLVLPMDFIPDAIPVVGFSDDMAAIVAAFKAVAECINPRVEAKAQAKLDTWFS